MKSPAGGDAEDGRRPLRAPGSVHAATNVGDVPAAELATYVIEKGKPLTQIERSGTHSKRPLSTQGRR
jgi:hypothetical protein